MKKKYTFLIALCLSIGINTYAQWTLPIVPVGTLDLQSASFASANVAYATGYSGNVIKSIDQGATWTSLVSGTTTDMYTTTFLDESVGFIMGDLGKIYKTTDGGLTWAQKTTGTTNTIYSSYALSNKTTIFAAGDQVLLKSTDAGETWVAQTNPVGSEAIRSIRFFDDNTGYIGATNNVLSTLMYKTTDGGSTWSTQTVPSHADGDPVSFFGISVVDANTAFSCGGSKRISKTTNGSTWTNINNSSANFYRGCLFTSANDGYVVGGNGKIIKTTNGSTFTSETTGTTALLTSITSNSNGAILVTGGNGAGVLVRKAAPGVSLQENNMIATVIYPNPVKDVLTIDTDKKISSMRILSLEGKEIASLKASKTIQVGNMTNGLYILELTFEKGEVSRNQFIKD